jgi:hypothetical protein
MNILKQKCALYSLLYMKSGWFLGEREGGIIWTLIYGFIKVGFIKNDFAFL